MGHVVQATKCYGQHGYTRRTLLRHLCKSYACVCLNLHYSNNGKSALGEIGTLAKSGHYMQNYTEVFSSALDNSRYFGTNTVHW